MTTVALCRALYKAHAADPARHVRHTARLSFPYSTVNLHEDNPTTVDVKRRFDMDKRRQKNKYELRTARLYNP